MEYILQIFVYNQYYDQRLLHYFKSCLLNGLIDIHSYLCLLRTEENSVDMNDVTQ